jgi:hypothetical protein
VMTGRGPTYPPTNCHRLDQVVGWVIP